MKIIMVRQKKTPYLLENSIKLINVTKLDCKFLYDLLKEREPKVNISHKKMPIYSQHVDFVMSKPYSKWYIIKIKNKRIGSAYLSKQDEIGIFIQKQFQKKGLGQTVLESIIRRNPRKRYLANINPKNTSSIKFFKNNAFKLIQYTYELISENNEATKK